ncbi:hypothetical protein NQ317_009296, partial [Molorchus minor]
MDREKKHRRVLRGLFTKKANELSTLLSPERERGCRCRSTSVCKCCK